MHYNFCTIINEISTANYINCSVFTLIVQSCIISFDCKLLKTFLKSLYFQVEKQLRRSLGWLRKFTASTCILTRDELAFYRCKAHFFEKILSNFVFSTEEEKFSDRSLTSLLKRSLLEMNFFVII